MKSIVTITAAVLFAFSAFAAEVKVATITSDVEKDVGVLLLEVVDGAVDTLRIQKVDGARILEDESHPIETLIQDGLVATERQGRKVVVLRFSGFSPATGGVVVVDFLSNGLTGNRKQYKIKLVKVGGEFVIQTIEGKAINSLHFVGNKIFGRVVGIRAVEVSFK